MTPSDHTVSSASVRHRPRRGRLRREVWVVALRGTRPVAKQSARKRFETRA